MLFRSGGEDAARGPGELVAENAVAVFGSGKAAAEGDEGGDLREVSGDRLPLGNGDVPRSRWRGLPRLDASHLRAANDGVGVRRKTEKAEDARRFQDPARAR